jgi:hypothetical protein
MPLIRAMKRKKRPNDSNAIIDRFLLPSPESALN